MEQREITVRASAGLFCWTDGGYACEHFGTPGKFGLKGLHVLITRTLTGTVQTIDLVLDFLDPCIF